METANIDAQQMARFLAGDKTANGQFIVGVRTTGIYCLPSCPARKPLPQNIVFADTPAEALALGLRPCKRCRPDAFYAGRDPDRRHALMLAARVRRDPGMFDHVSDMAVASPWGITKLTAMLRAHCGLTPAALLTQARAEAAARLLRDPHKPVLEAGFEAGFESASAFYGGFRRRYGCAPGEYQKYHDDCPVTP